MATTKEISVYLIGETAVNLDEVSRWMDSHDVTTDLPNKFGLTNMNPDLSLPDTESEAIIGLAAKRCYLSFKPGLNKNVKKVRDNWREFFENILKSRHGSVLEHAVFNFAIEGCTRVFTAEMNRHRAGVAISEGSMRYVRCDDLTYWEPHSLHSTGAGDPDRLKKGETLTIFRETFEYIEKQYAELLKIWDIDSLPFEQKKKLTSMFRRIVPMGVSTGGVWSVNVRALRHIIELRTSAAAEEEIQLVCSTMAKMIFERQPNLFCDFEYVDGAWIPKYSKV
jgi:thymidylate synthase (FAD)